MVPVNANPCGELWIIAAVSPLPATVAPWSIVAGVIVGAGVGIISGIYPASRASKLDPIFVRFSSEFGEERLKEIQDAK